MQASIKLTLERTLIIYTGELVLFYLHFFPLAWSWILKWFDTLSLLYSSQFPKIMKSIWSFGMTSCYGIERGTSKGLIDFPNLVVWGDQSQTGERVKKKRVQSQAVKTKTVLLHMILICYYPLIEAIIITDKRARNRTIENLG